MIRRCLGRLSVREACIASAIVLSCIGAAIAALAAPAQGLRYGAEAAIAVERDSPPARADHYAAAATLPQVIAGARVAAGSSLAASHIAERTVVGVKPALGLVLVRVQETSQARALALANGLAEQALLFVKANVAGPHDGVRELGDFESGGSQGWTHASAFHSRPLNLQPMQGGARFGAGKLRIACAAKSACGPALRVYGSFHERATYLAEGWVRSTAGRSRVTLLVGLPGSVGISPGDRFSAGWRRLRAIWTPKADSSSAEVAVQVTSPRPVTFDLDGVRLFDSLVDTEDVTGGRRGRPGPVSARPSGSLVPAVPLEVDRKSPAGPGLLGAGAGLVVALTAIGFAQLARRRGEVLRAPAP